MSSEQRLALDHSWSAITVALTEDGDSAIPARAGSAAARPSVLKVRGEADETVNKLIVALRERAGRLA